MRKSRTNSVLFGVCGGIAEEYNLNPFFLRLAFACAFAFFGAGVLVYLILAICMN